MSVEQILAERGERYGNFIGHSRLAQGIKAVMQGGRNWPVMTCDQREALEMVAHKIGRILNGDPNYADSWTDCIGYLRLVEKQLVESNPEADAGFYDAHRARIRCGQ